MSDMPKLPGLQRRGSRWYLRMKVPKDLKDQYRNGAGNAQFEIVKSLGTGDRAEAAKRYIVERAKAEAEFDRLRRQIDSTQARVPTEGEMSLAVWDWFQSMEAADVIDFQRVLHGRAEKPAQSPDDIRLSLLSDEANLTTFDEQTIASHQSTARIVARKQGLNFDETTAEFDRFVELCRRASLESVRRALQRLNGETWITPHDQLFVEQPSQPAASVTVERLIDAFQDEASSSRLPRLKLEYAVVFALLREVIGKGRAVKTINREDCRKVASLLKRLPPNASKRFQGVSLTEAAEIAERSGLATMQPNTVNGYLTKMGTLFRWAVREEYMEYNPAAEMKIKDDLAAKRDLRRPFDLAQLKAIFSAPLYRGCKNDQHGYAEPGPNVVRGTRFFIPLIALFSGMRLNEICQLHVADIVQVDGIDCISVTEQGDVADAPKVIKSVNARRKIPVHAELRRAGLIRFVDAQRDAGCTRLFPDLPRTERGYYSDAFQKWFARFCTKAGASGKRTSFHSFRHSFRDAMREAGISDEIARALGGWSDQNTSEVYGEGFRISTLNTNLQKVVYPGLDLASLHVDD